MLAALCGDAVAHSRSNPRRRASACNCLPNVTCRWCPRQLGCTRHILKCADWCPSARKVCSRGARDSGSPSCGTYSTAKAARVCPAQAPRHTCGGSRHVCHIDTVFLRNMSGRSSCSSTFASSFNTSASVSSPHGRISRSFISMEVVLR